MSANTHINSCKEDVEAALKATLADLPSIPPATDDKEEASAQKEQAPPNTFEKMPFDQLLA